LTRMAQPNPPKVKGNRAILDYPVEKPGLS